MFTKMLYGFMLVMAVFMSPSVWATIPGTVCGSQTSPLTAGQTLDVGYVTIANDDTNMYVQFSLDPDKLAALLSDDAYFKEFHVWIGPNLDEMPSGPQGQPIPGQFPYSFAPPTDGVTEYTFVIPLIDLGLDTMKCPFDELFVVTHTAIDMDGNPTTGGTETGFGGTNPGPGPRWWFYDKYTPCCDDTPPPPPTQTCETAFGYGNYILAKDRTFKNGRTNNPDDLMALGLKTRRWGWANTIEVGDHAYDIYAGAGLNHTSKGELVGTVGVSWDGDFATVTIMLDGEYTMDELHIYLSDEAPTTTAPGQYGINEYFDPDTNTFSETYHVEDTDGDGKVWLIVHSVVCTP